MLLISLAQSDVNVDWNQSLMDAAAARPWMTSADMKALSTHASQLSDLVQRLRRMKLDVTEYTCLKALVLFRPGIRYNIRLRLLTSVALLIQFVTPADST